MSTTQHMPRMISCNGPVYCSRYHRRGAIMVCTLLALTLLVGLIFYVYNTGSVMNRRLDLQNAADATAISGANWMARSMNVVAMDNVATSRLMAAVVVLDSLPLSVEMALTEATSWQQGLSDQLLLRSIPQTKDGKLVNDGLKALVERMAAQVDLLTSVDMVLKTFPMESATTWQVAGEVSPYGTLWQACISLDELSQMTVQSAGPLAQQSAVGWGDCATLRPRRRSCRRFCPRSPPIAPLSTTIGP